MASVSAGFVRPDQALFATGGSSTAGSGGSADDRLEAAVPGAATSSTTADPEAAGPSGSSPASSPDGSAAGDDEEPLGPGTPGEITGSGSPGAPRGAASTPPPVELAIVEPFAPAAPPAPEVDLSPIDLLEFPAQGPIDDFVSNEPGCAGSCLTTAIVTRSAFTTKLNLEVETNVPAHIRVYVSTSAPTITGGVPSFVGVSPVTTSGGHVTSWSGAITGLDADTTYHVIVKATDVAGRSQSITGPVRTTPQHDQLVASGDGCTFQCITSGYAHLTHRFDVVNIGVETSTEVDLTVAVSTQEPGWIGGSPILPADVPVEVPGGWHRSWYVPATGLAPSTTYYVVIRATDPEGRHSSRIGSFTTAPEPPATIEVTLERVHIGYDGDVAESNAGEIALSWYLADGQVVGARSEEKVHDGTTIDIGAHHKVYQQVPRGGVLSPTVVNVIEEDRSRQACSRLGLGVATEPYYHQACDAHVNVAQTGVMTRERVEALPGCATYGMPTYLDDHRCQLIVSPDLTDGYATFYAVVSYKVL